MIDRRIATRRDAFTRLFGERPPMRVLLAASTESEWVACHLESLGHEAIVADPNYAAMYGGRSRRIKTDLRDVAALTTACVQGIYRPIHRPSAARRAIQAQLRVRDEWSRAGAARFPWVPGSGRPANEPMRKAPDVAPEVAKAALR